MKQPNWISLKLPSLLAAIMLTTVVMVVCHYLGNVWSSIALCLFSFVLIEWLLGRTREGARRMRLLADSMPQFVWISDSEGNIVYINKRWYDYTGQDERRKDRDMWLDVVHEDDRERAMTAHLEAMRERKPNQIELRLRNRRGEYRWHLARSIAIEDRKGKEVLRFGTSTDIHDNHVLLRKLAETRSRFDAALRGVSDSVLLLDADWRITLVSDGLLHSLQRPREEVMGKVGWEIFPELIGTRFEQEFRRAMSMRQSVHFEYLSPVTNRWTEIRAFPYEDGLAGFASDIHDRKKAEDKARTSAHQLQIIADAAPISIVYVDHRERYVFANRYYEVHHGRLLNEIVGRTVREIVGERHYAKIKPMIQDVMSGKSVFQEIEVQHPSGASILVDATYSPHFGPDREVLGYVEISKGIAKPKEESPALGERLVNDRPSGPHPELLQK